MIRFNELERFASVVCSIECRTKENGIYLNLDDLDDDIKPIVKAYNWYGSIGDKVLCSVQKIDKKRNYIRVSVDSMLAA